MNFLKNSTLYSGLLREKKTWSVPHQYILEGANLRLTKLWEKKERNVLHDAVVVCGDVGTGAELQGALFGHLQDNKSKGRLYKVHTGRLK